MAIVQKMINCSTSTTPNQEIPMDKVVSFDKYQIGTDPNGVTLPEVGIRFAMDLTSPVRDLKLVYSTSAITTAAAIILRDASYAAIKAAAAQTTV